MSRTDPKSTVACREFALALEYVADEAADEIATARARDHAAGCTTCRGLLEAARAYRRRLREVGAGDRASDALRATVASAHREVRGSPTR